MSALPSQEPGVDEAARVSIAIRKTRRRTLLGTIVAVAIFFLSLGAATVGAYVFVPADAPDPTPALQTRGGDGGLRAQLRDPAVQQELRKRQQLRWGIMGGGAVAGLALGALAYARCSRPVPGADEL
ncbi:MAG: hypothetical protein IT378_15535 [Sandaracinaceae bacterium]|nr:hypothetical protein [Sandaracinaceae bacterium]